MKTIRSISEKAAVCAWKSGLGGVMNLLPSAFGRNLVLRFPARNKDLVLNYVEKDGVILALLPEEEFPEVEDILLSGTGAEVWMKNGWFTASALLLSEKESEEMGIPDPEAAYGSIGSLVPGFSVRNCRMVRIVRNAPCTGEHGPGEFSWVWAALAGLLLLSSGKKEDKK